MTQRLAAASLLVASLGLGLPGEAADKAIKKAAAKLESAALAARIDQAILQRLESEGIRPSPRADDAEFLRRVYLDIIGVVPSAEKAREFIESKDPDKRAKLIDELLANPQFGRHMADIWSGLIIPKNSDNQRLQPAPLHDWFAKQFSNNKPWDKLVFDLLTSAGEQNENGAVTFFLANPTVDKMTDVTSSLFLGVQLQCAQCHNHPFTKWKQEEYWGMAMFFTKVRPDNVRQAAKKDNKPGVTEVPGPRGRGQKLPDSAKQVPPKFLLAEHPKMDDRQPYRPVVAKWITSPENPFFAKAMVNRLWHQFFGRGIVNAVDDMHDGNKPSHPELLGELTQQFIAGGFDVKHMIRTICNSETYQRTSKPADGNETDAVLFSHAAVRTMSPEQLYDSLEAVLGKPEVGRGRPAQRPQPMRGGPRGERAQFVAFFQTDDGADPTEYGAGIPQALRMMNSNRMNSTSPLVNQVAKLGTKPEQVIESLYLAALARRPSAEQTTRLLEHVKSSSDAKKAYGDILWALVNSSEFAFNH